MSLVDYLHIPDMSTTKGEVTTQPFQISSNNNPPAISGSISDNHPPTLSWPELSITFSLLFLIIAFSSLIIILSPSNSNQTSRYDESRGRVLQSNFSPSSSPPLKQFKSPLTPSTIQFEPTTFLIDTNHSIAYCTIQKNVCSKFREDM